jgi:hypothetical protein
VGPYAPLDRCDQTGPGELVEKSSRKSPQIAQIAMPMSTLLLCSKQLDENLCLAPREFVKWIALPLQIDQADLVGTLSGRADRC